MNLRTIWKLALTMMLALMLAACGGGGGDDDGGEPTSTGSETSGSTLPQSIDSEDFSGGTLTVGFPEAWVAQGVQGAIYLANSQEALEMANVFTALTENQVAGTVTFIPAAMLGADANQSLTDVIADLTGRLSETGIVAELGEPESFTVNGKNGVITSGDGEDNGVALSLAIAIVEEGDGYAILAFGATPGQIGQHEDTLKAIAGSIEYIAGATDATAEAVPAGEATVEPTPAG